MGRYNDPRDRRIYDTEQIREWARRDIVTEIETIKLKKKRKEAIFNGIIMSGLLLTLLYVLWTFMKSAQLI